MVTSTTHLGGRAKLLSPEEMTEAQRQLYDSFVQHAVPWAKSAGFTGQVPGGSVIGPFNIALYSPEIGAAFAKLQSVEESETTLSERVRQVVILTIGALWQCDYERYAHKAVARKAGLAPETIEVLANEAEPLQLNEEESLACEFTRRVATDHKVSPKLFQQAEASFGVRGIVDLLFLAGCYFTVCSLLNSFEVPTPTA